MKTKRCELRHWRVEDAYELYELAKDPDVGPRAGWKPHENVQESRKIIEEVLHNDEDYAIIDRNSGHIIGCISLMMPGHSNVSLHDQEVELGYWLGKEFWGQGYIPEAAQCLVDHAFYKLHAKRIYCGYAKGNE